MALFQFLPAGGPKAAPRPAAQAVTDDA
jgi:hypothetical protein